MTRTAPVIVLLTAIILIITSCQTKYVNEYAEKENPGLWFYEETDAGAASLYFVSGGRKRVKIADHVALHSHVAFEDRVLFLDGQGSLFAAEAGAKPLKIGEDISLYNYAFSADGTAIFYISKDRTLFYKIFGREPTLISYSVTVFQPTVSGDYVYYLTTNKELHAFSRKDGNSSLLAENVLSLFSAGRNHIIYVDGADRAHLISEYAQAIEVPIKPYKMTQIKNNLFISLADYDQTVGKGNLYLINGDGDSVKTELIARGANGYEVDSTEKFAYFISSGKLFRAELQNRHVESVSALPGLEFALDQAGKAVYLLTVDHELYILENQMEQLISRNVSGFFAMRGKMSFLTEENKLYVYNLAQSEPEHIGMSERFMVANGYAVFSNYTDGIIYVLSEIGESAYTYTIPDDVSFAYIENQIVFDRNLRN